MKLKNNKESYRKYHDKIIEKRFLSENKLRNYAHLTELKSIVKNINKDSKIIDLGCGEGMLCFMLAKKGIKKIVGIDISSRNIVAAKKYAIEKNINIDFLEGDVENINFNDLGFDKVTSTHVLEHIPNIDKGISEIYRLTKEKAIIAMPTCLNPCSMIQCGYGSFFRKRPRDFISLFIGILRTILALVTFKEGVNETYGPDKMPHVWRFPWVVKNKLKKHGFAINKIEASTLCLPYFENLLPLIKKLDKYKSLPILNYLGYGTIIFVRKKKIN